MKIELKNYQSIKTGTVELKGLVGIIGQNNQGKTAIMRAVRDFATIDFGKEKIRQDEKEGTITIDGVTVKRVLTTTTLITDKEEKKKLENKNITELTNIKDFLIINNDKIKDFLIQFSFQREKLSPFSLNNSQLFYLFSMLFDMETINKIFMYTKDKIKEDENEIKYIKGKLDEVLKQKLRIEEIHDKLPAVERLEKLNYKYEGLTKLSNDIIQKQLLDMKLKNLKEFKSKLNIKNYEKYIKLLEIKNLYDKYNKLIGLKTTLTKYTISLWGLKQKILKLIKSNIQKFKQPIELSWLHDKKLKAETIKLQNKKEQAEVNLELSTFKVCPLCGGQI